MTDYEKYIEEEAQAKAKKVAMLKRVCEENGIELKEFLLAGIALELEKIRSLKEYEE